VGYCGVEPKAEDMPPRAPSIHPRTSAFFGFIIYY
jgi:hypothetical protein